MNKRGIFRSCIVAFIALLLLLAPVPLVSMKAAMAQNSPEEDKPGASSDAAPAEIIDSGTMGEDIFPDTKPITKDDILKPHDPYSKTTENPDGTFTKDIFFDPINWKDSDGNWQEIDSTLIQEELDGYFFANASNAFRFRLSKKSGDGKTCVLELDGKKFKLQLLGHGKYGYKVDDKGEKQEVKDGTPITPEEAPATEASPELDCVAEGNQAYHYDNKKGYSLEFIIFNSTIEQLIKLDSPDSPNTFNFKLDMEGMDIEKDELGNLRVISQEDGRQLFTITAPVMMDSNADPASGEPAISHEVSLDITKDKEGKALLTITADPTWLSDPARVYPVYIDPAWIGIAPYYDQMYADKTNRGDTFCNSNNPSTNYGGYFTYFGGGYILNCGYVNGMFEPLGGESKVLIGADIRKFFHNIYYDDSDGTKYNASAKIDQAYFNTYCYWSSNNGYVPIDLGYPTQDWEEDTATWNNYPPVSSGTSFNALTGQWNSIDVTPQAQSWVKGVENGGTLGRGFSLNVSWWGQGLGAKFKAREDASYGPRLSVLYTMLGCPYGVDEVPTKWIAGETRYFPVFLMNTGSEAWQCDNTNPTNPVRLGYYITDQNGGNKQPEGRVQLPRDIQPWESVCLMVPLTAPTTTGNWRINLGMVKENQYWFASKGVNYAKVNIQVEAPGTIPADPERTASSQITIPWMSHTDMGGLSTNLVNGSTTFSATDLSVAGRGVPFGLSRTYTSTTVEHTPASLFGPNWFSGLDVKVKDYGNGYLAYYDASGKSYLLVQANKANTFVGPEGYYIKAEKNPNYTNIADPDDNKNWKYKVLGTSGVAQHFDETGKLIYITDASRQNSGTGNYKNKTKINYNFGGSGNIQVVDASGRTFTVLISVGKIASVSEDASWASADGHIPRTVSYEYAGPGGRLTRITLNPGDHWGSITYSETEPNLIVQTETKVDTEVTHKAYFEYSGGKLISYRNPRSSSPTDNTYRTTIAYNSGNTIVSSPPVSSYLGTPNVQLSSKYVFSTDGKGHTTDIYSGVNPDGSGGFGRKSYEWNTLHQVTKVTDYQNLTTPLGSTSYIYDGKGNASQVEDQLPGGEKAISTADYTASKSCASNLTAASSPDGDKVSLQYDSGEDYFKSTDMIGAESVVLRDPTTENGKLSVTLPAPFNNLLQNGSAEKDADSNGIADGWTAWENINPAGATTYQVYAAPEGDSAAAGRKVQRLRIQGNTNIGDMTAVQNVGVSMDTEYTLSFDYRNNPNPNQETRVQIRQLDPSGGTLSVDYLVLKPSATWAHQSWTFKTKACLEPTTLDIILCVRATQTGQDIWADFDAVQLLKGSRDTAFNHVDNAAFERSVTNGSFVDPADWTVSAYYRTEGTWSTARYVSPAASVRLGTNTAYAASQTVNVKRNTRYLISGYVYAEGEATSGGAIMTCGNEYLYAGSSKGYYGQDTQYLTKTGKWVRLFKVVNSGNADTLNVGLGNLMGGTGRLSAYFDNISLTELPDDSETTYDARGNYVTQAKTPAGANSYYIGYIKTDPVGNVLEARDARSASSTDGTYLFTYTYNELSKLTSVVSPLVRDAEGDSLQAYASSYNYDTAGRLLWLNDNNTEETSYEYNQTNQVTGKTDPNLRTVQVEYNEVGGVKKVTYPDPDPNDPNLNGWEACYAYRADGRLDKVAFRDPQGNVTNPYTFTYDGTGRLTSVSDSITGITLNFTFDLASRLTASSSGYAGGFTSNYTYSKGGRLTSLKYSKSGWKPNNDYNNKVTYAYRNSGEHSTMTLPNRDTINYVYEDRGRLSSIRYVTNPASTTCYNSSSFTYDAAGRLSSITHNFYDSGLKMSYEYDALGNITRSVQDNVENLYTYDELCRLVSWTEKTDGQITNEQKYYYDGNGNIVSVNNNGTPENHAYDDANQCIDNGFSHDAGGNLISDGEWIYSYDRGSRLISAQNDASNLKVVFGYDPKGRRYSKTAYERDGQGNYTVQKYAVFYHYDAGGNVLCETDSAGAVIRSYAYDLAGRPVAMTQDLGQGQKTFYIHTNVRGDVVCITDDVMNWVKKYSYDPWGKVISETSRSSQYDSLTCPYAYAGYFRDAETGLYYMPARYYSPDQRRFLTKDPAPGKKSSPITLNPYQYCSNNPMNKVDPTGQYDISFSLEGVGPVDFSSVFRDYGDGGVGMLTSARATIASAGPGLNNFANSMASFNASVHSSLAGFNAPSFNLSLDNRYFSVGWGKLAPVGICGGRTEIELVLVDYWSEVWTRGSSWPEEGGDITTNGAYDGTIGWHHDGRAFAMPYTSPEAAGGMILGILNLVAGFFDPSWLIPGWYDPNNLIPGVPVPQDI